MIQERRKKYYKTKCIDWHSGPVGVDTYSELDKNTVNDFMDKLIADWKIYVGNK